MVEVNIQASLITWARERAGRQLEELRTKPSLGSIEEWEAGNKKPTFRQLEKFAKVVHVPIGYLFMDEPPKERLPIADFRTFGSDEVHRPSPDLLDTIYICQERQDWYREYVKTTTQPLCDFVGSATLSEEHVLVAERMREKLGFDASVRRECKDPGEMRKAIAKKARDIGVLVMINGIVRSNTSRGLNVKEFRGFAIADKLAPLIFVNAADSKAGQNFTLAHELAHLWLGEAGISSVVSKQYENYRKEEIWCNKVAAEFLVPMTELKSKVQQDESDESKISHVVKAFNVSRLVALLRLEDAKLLEQGYFREAWPVAYDSSDEIEEKPKSPGGNFYNILISRVGSQFISALGANTFEGKTLYRDAFHLLGISNEATFKKIYEAAREKVA